MHWSPMASRYAADRDTDRKAMTKRLESAVRTLMAAALRGRPLAVERAG